LITDFEDAAGFFSGFDVSEEADEVKGGCSEVLASVRWRAIVGEQWLVNSLAGLLIS